MYDVFISYRRKTGTEFARMLYEKLKSFGMNIFFDIEEIHRGKFNEKLYDSIINSKYFILILSEGSLDSCTEEGDWLRLEIGCAFRNGIEIIPVMLDGFRYPDKNLNEIEELRLIQAVPFNEYYFEPSIDKITDRLKNVRFSKRKSDIKSGGISSPNEVKARTHISDNGKSDFFSDKNRNERIRLERQQALLLNYDKEVYDKLLCGKKDLNVLDIGSGSGSALMQRFGDREEIGKIIGVEFNRTNVDDANEKYKGSKASFYEADVEAYDFIDTLKEIMEENNIGKFDFINILAVVSHLKNPAKVIRNVKKVCSENAVIFIRNIDDGFNIAYPDEKGDFSKALSIPCKLTSCGYRFSGRQVYGMLKNADYRDIVLEKSGISSVGMGYEDREALFEVLFRFIMNGIVKELTVTDSEEISELYNWYTDIYDELEERFMHNDFFFNLGFLIYTARV